VRGIIYILEFLAPLVGIYLPKAASAPDKLIPLSLSICMITAPERANYPSKEEDTDSYADGRAESPEQVI
jgi:hypothetical protein